jgi:hypothetical protein
LVDDIGRCDEKVMASRPLLDDFLFPVEALERCKIVCWNTECLCFFAVYLVTKNTDMNVWTDDVWEFDCADETLIFDD